MCRQRAWVCCSCLRVSLKRVGDEGLVNDGKYFFKDLFEAFGGLHNGLFLAVYVKDVR